MKNNDKVSYKDLYELFDKKLTTVDESIRRLENKFDLLEAGRVSRLEKDLANLNGKIIATTTTIAFVTSTIVAVAGFLLK